jgi:hypothetical protein
MEAERCWAGTRNGASNGTVDTTCDFARSEDARQSISSRGAMTGGSMRMRRCVCVVLAVDEVCSSNAKILDE